MPVIINRPLDPNNAHDLCYLHAAGKITGAEFNRHMDAIIRSAYPTFFERLKRLFRECKSN